MREPGIKPRQSDSWADDLGERWGIAAGEKGALSPKLPVSLLGRNSQYSHINLDGIYDN